MAIREINLVPPEVLSRRYMLRHVYLWLGLLSFSMLLVVGFYIQQSGRALTLKGTAPALNDAAVDLGAKIDEIKRLQAELDALSRSQSIMDTIGRQKPYSQLLLNLSLQMNERTWFRTITATSASGPDPLVNMLITGFSRSNDDLGEFISRLTLDPSFEGVVLKYTRGAEVALPGREQEDMQTVIQFQIECKAS